MGQISGPTTFKRQPRNEKKQRFSFSGAGKGKIWGIGLLSVAIVLGAGGGIYAYMQWRVDPDVARVQEMIADGRVSGATEEERREQWQQIQEARENLTEEQQKALDERLQAERRAAWEERSRQMREQETERIAQFHTLSPEEQTAQLDEQIDRMVEWQEQMEERRKEREQNRESQGEGEQGQRGGGGQGRGGGEARGGGAEGAGDRPQRDPEERRERRQQGRRDRLADTTPEQRAQWANYREQMRKRMEERGIEFGGGPGRRGPR